MSFYNRLLAQPVGTFVDLLGKSRPVDVAPMGGASKVVVTTAAGNVTILPAPSAGFAYRLHRLTMFNGPSAWLINSGSPLATYGVLSASGVGNGGVDNLDGQIVTEAIQLNSGTAGSPATLTYDLVIAPTIQ